MKNANPFIISIVVIMSLISTTGIFGQDWPQWRGINRDGKVTGFIAPKAWPDQLTLKWQVPVGAGAATPALVANYLYVFTRQDSEEVTLCLNADNGREIWRDKYVARAVTGAAARHPGPRSSPAVANGKVITLGVGGILTCLDAATGKIVWRKDEFSGLVPQFFTGMSPIIVDGMVIAHLGGQDDGAITAYDLNTGNRKWKWSGDGPAYASPVLMTVAGTKQLVVQTEKNIVSVAVADGKLLWQIPTPTQRRFFNCASPIVAGQTVFYTGQGEGTRAVTIEKQGDGFIATGLWNNEEMGTCFNTPVLKDGLLFGMEKSRGNLFCLNAKTGQTAWADTTKLDRFGAVLDAGSVMLALPATAELIAFKPDDKEYLELARIKVADTPVYAHPVIAGNRIFIKGQEKLTLWTID